MKNAFVDQVDLLEILQQHPASGLLLLAKPFNDLHCFNLVQATDVPGYQDAAQNSPYARNIDLSMIFPNALIELIQEEQQRESSDSKVITLKTLLACAWQIANSLNRPISITLQFGSNDPLQAEHTDCGSYFP